MFFPLILIGALPIDLPAAISIVHSVNASGVPFIQTAQPRPNTQPRGNCGIS